MRSSGGAIWLPTSLPDLTWWGEPRLETITTVGSKASQMVALGGSKSGTIVFSQSDDGLRPTYHADGGPNDIPYLSAATGDKIMRSAVSMFATSQARTVVTAAKVGNYETGGNTVFCNKSTGPVWEVQFYQGIYLYSDGASINIGAVPFPSAPTLQAPFVSEFSNASLPSQLVLNVNGSAVAVTGIDAKVDSGADGCSIMNRGDAPSQGLEGEFYGIACYSRVLDPAERVLLRNYFGTLVGAPIA